MVHVAGHLVRRRWRFVMDAGMHRKRWCGHGVKALVEACRRIRVRMMKIVVRRHFGHVMIHA
jgi:hypothetical protein